MKWKQVLIPPHMPILDVVRIIDQSALQIALVVDEQQRLMGAVTDGDIRRGLLRSVALSDPIDTIMNRNPIKGHVDDTPETILSKMLGATIQRMPIVDAQGRVIGLKGMDEELAERHALANNWVVLMAGGLGTRLHPLTHETPKPMLKVGDRPILETIIKHLIRHRFRRFYIAVNYKADMIRDFFGNGEKLGVQIRYLEEKKKMGTAGALGLIDQTPSSPLLVMNGDLLTKINFKSLLDFHHDEQADATMAVRSYDVQVPFGVVDIDRNHIKRIDEKPRHHFFVNAGIYILNPDMLARVPKDRPSDMTELFDDALQAGCNIAAFPVREYWLDIGRLDDFQRANSEYRKTFDEKA